MSQITKALQRAEAERRLSTAGRTAGFSGLFHGLKQELKEEFGRGQSAPVSGNGPVVMPNAIKGNAGVSSVTQAGPFPATGTPETWDGALDLVKRRLAASEEQTARHAAEAVRLTAQLKATDQLLSAMQAERTTLLQRLEEEKEAAASVEADKASWLRQLDSLRQCQLLSHEARMTEQELKVNAAALEQLAQSQQQVAKEVAHYQQRAGQLEQRVRELHFKLAQALAFTGTTDPSATAERSA